MIFDSGDCGDCGDCGGVNCWLIQWKPKEKLGSTVSTPSTPSTRISTLHFTRSRIISYPAATSTTPHHFLSSGEITGCQPHSIASVSHFTGPYRRAQASLNSASGPNDQPFPLFVRYFVHGTPIVSSSTKKFLSAFSDKSHRSLGTLSLASSIKLRVNAVFGLSLNPPGNAPSCSNITNHCSIGGKVKPCCFCNAALHNSVSGISLGCHPSNSIRAKSQNCMSSEHFGQLAWQFKRMSGSSGLKVQAAMAC